MPKAASSASRSASSASSAPQAGSEMCIRDRPQCNIVYRVGDEMKARLLELRKEANDEDRNSEVMQEIIKKNF